jgi:hypothetical protein
METRRGMLARMKLPLASGLLSAAVFDCASTGGPSSGRYVMRVDRKFDRNAHPLLPTDELSSDSYRELAPADRWQIAIDGPRVVLTQIGDSLAGVGRLEGQEESGGPTG